MTVHLLGGPQVVFGERPVSKWVSGRGRAVLEYLVAHRHTGVRRDHLMATFWPDAEPGAARNSLNVAIHGLRRSLRAAAGDHPVLTYRDGRFTAGDYRGCADACRTLLACDPCREDTQGLLMRCHSRLGQPQLALRTYHALAATLRTELQLAPGPGHHRPRSPHPPPRTRLSRPAMPRCPRAPLNQTLNPDRLAG